MTTRCVVAMHESAGRRQHTRGCAFSARFFFCPIDLLKSASTAVECIPVSTILVPGVYYFGET